MTISSPGSTRAREFLDQVVHHYQSLTSYQDSAWVELRYLVDGQPTVDRAPMSVAWDRSGRLGLNIYSIQAGPTESERWHLRVRDVPEFANQVLSRAIPNRVTFEWLLSDPIVDQQLGAGLAGFPPQLDLLLSHRPLEKLLQGASDVSLLDEQTFDGRVSQGIQIQHGPLRYKLWVDAKSHLLRRLELPSDNLPPAILNSPDFSDIQLAIEFLEVQINQPIHWDSLQVSAQPDDHRVMQLSPAPPQVDLRGYGKMIPAFQLRDAAGSVQYDSRVNAERKATVLTWLANHPACRVAAEQLAAAEKSLKESGIGPNQVEFISVWAEPNPPDGIGFEQLATHWKLPGKLVIDKSAAGRDLFHIEEAPTTVILDAQGRLQLRDAKTNPLLDHALPTLIQRVLAGDSLADELQTANQQVNQRFQAQLVLLAAEDRLPDQQSNQVSYPPQHLQLIDLARQTYGARVEYLIQDANHAPWILLNDGTLHRLDDSLTPQETLQTRWINSGSQSSRLEISPDSRFFAYAGVQTGNVEILDRKTGQSLQFDLPSDSEAVDIEWLSIPQAHAPRLAVITDSKHMLLLDPESREQLSGTCPDQPLAIVGNSKPARRHLAYVVLANGRMEVVKIPGDDGQALGEGSVRQGSELPTDSSVKQILSFQPSRGFWVPATDGAVPRNTDAANSATFGAPCMLAQGLIAKGEPAAYFLDENFRTLWHYRLPIESMRSNNIGHRAASAKSPGNGARIWAILDVTGTIHLLSEDAIFADHFRPTEKITNLVLIPQGDRLVLILSTPEEIISYAFK